MEKAAGRRGVVSPPSRDGWNCPQLVLKLPFALFPPLSLSLGKNSPLPPPTQGHPRPRASVLSLHLRTHLSVTWYPQPVWLVCKPVASSPSCTKKEVVSNRKRSWAITLWALQIPVYKATCLIYVQDRSLRCQRVLSESTRHSCTRG